MTPHEKAAQTLKQHKAAQKRKAAEAKAERELIKKSLREVLEREDATAAEKLEAARLLLEAE